MFTYVIFQLLGGMRIVLVYLRILYIYEDTPCVCLAGIDWRYVCCVCLDATKCNCTMTVELNKRQEIRGDDITLSGGGMQTLGKFEIQ